ncbi:MAG TPA: restriction endonuclease [Pseudohongiella sp.]|nr:restriction endonuclease [Pseudohongiella sp.]
MSGVEKLWDIPDTWEWLNMSDLGDVVGGGTPASKEPAYWGGNINWISPADLTGYNHKTITKGAKSLTELGLKNCSAKVMPAGSVHFSSRAPIGYVVISSLPMSTNQGFKSLVPRDGVLNEYVYYYLKGAKQLAEKRASGTTFLELSGKAFGQLPVPLPPFDDQKRIVKKIETLLSELDKGIESLKTAREQLKVYRQAVLKYAFEGKLTAQWREENKDKLESPEQLLARIQHEREARYQQQLGEWKAAVKSWEVDGKEGKKPGKPTLKELVQLSENEIEQLPPLPEGYVYTYLANVGELGRGKSKHRPRNDPRLFGGVYPFLQTAEVKSASRVINSYEQTYSEFGLSQSYLWPKGTLCITIAANIAETAFLGFDACFPDSVVGFTALEGAVLPEYIELFIKAVRVRIEAYAPATAQKNINLSTLESLVVPLCSIDEQKYLIEQIESRFSIIEKNEAEIDAAVVRAYTLRQSILKEAFSGELAA